jgi:hypothetical protein
MPLLPAGVMKTIYKIAQQRAWTRARPGNDTYRGQPDTHFRRFDDDASLIAH